MAVPEVKRLKSLEEDNARLKKLLAEASRWLRCESTDDRPEVELLYGATILSQRHACRLTGLTLSTCRFETLRPAVDAHLLGHITELALDRRHFSYRRIRREGLHVNHKRVCRFWTER